MTLQQLVYFCTIVEYQSISRAANYLHIAQPSLSIAIKKLEDELGLSLFHRINKHITITEEGTFGIGAKFLITVPGGGYRRLQSDQEEET